LAYSQHLEVFRTYFLHSWGLKEESIERVFKNHPSLPTQEDIFEQIKISYYSAQKEIIENIVTLFKKYDVEE